MLVTQQVGRVITILFIVTIAQDAKSSQSNDDARTQQNETINQKNAQNEYNIIGWHCELELQAEQGAVSALSTTRPVCLMGKSVAQNYETQDKVDKIISLNFRGT